DRLSTGDSALVGSSRRDALRRPRRHLDGDVDAVLDTLSDRAEVLEHVETASNPVDVGRIERWLEPHAQRTDSQPAALVAHQLAFDRSGQVLQVDTRFLETVLQARGDAT